MNRDKIRDGEVSLLIREPVADRLTLQFSTVPALNPKSDPDSEYVADLSENYDDKTRCVYYDLKDKLLSGSVNRSENKLRKIRGLTGWVAVSGIPLRVNREADEQKLSSIPDDNPDARKACDRFGCPMWGHRVSELGDSQKLKDDPLWQNRYIAVPVFSATVKKLTIGVLRYTCSLRDQELTRSDLSYLMEASRIVSALLNVRSVRSRSNRELTKSSVLERFEHSFDVRRILEFIRESMESEIASLYVTLSKGSETRIRLVDAAGLPEEIEELRLSGRLKDHSSAHTRKGITGAILSTEKPEAYIVDSVLDAPEWEGLNTAAFYQIAFEKVGLSIDHANSHSEDIKDLLGSYKIKLMGIRLDRADRKVGVLKVEFPRRFDSQNLYYDVDDRIFFRDCARSIAHVVAKIQDFMEGRWFPGKGDQDAEEFLLLAYQVVRLGLVSKSDQHFLDSVQRYLRPKKVRRSVLRIAPRTLVDYFGAAKDNRKSREIYKWFVDKIKDQSVREFIEKAFDQITKSVGDLPF